ncbi:hypothetical protein [Dialister sp.]|uniref:hypothetical protein n=1 Tax=Dialister sp. TaxID=1955814 RepID=UPI002E8158E5|nr:hypothetical protein [Dialister sp.]MEE3452590.1 hypothetical protein [Dialister sp.]
MIVIRGPWSVIREGGAPWGAILYGGNGGRRDYGGRIEIIAMIVIRGPWFVVCEGGTLGAPFLYGIAHCYFYKCMEIFFVSEKIS